MRVLWRGLWVAMVGLLTGNCSGVDLLNRLSPDAGIETRRDIAYGPAARNRLDVYRPVGASGAPTVVFFYGGSWQEGDRGDYAFVARALADSGFVVVVPDYRVYPQVKFAGFMRDGAAATAWAKRHAREFGGDPARLVVMGHSAGAEIAALLALDRRWLAAERLDPRRDLAGMVGLAGPYDFLPIRDPILQVIFGPPAVLADTQPINFVDGRNPPLFLATGAGDTTVEPRNTAALAEKVRAAGGPVESRVYSALSHRTIIGVVSQPLGGLSSVRGDVTDFIRSLRPTSRVPMAVAR